MQEPEESSRSEEPRAADGTESGPSLPVPRPLVETVFIVRVPWCIVLYLLMAAASAYLLFIPFHFWHPHGVGRIWALMVSELDLVIAAMVPAFIMARIEKRPFGNYGLPARVAFGKLFWAGTAWGILSLTVLMFAMRSAGVFYFGGLALHGVRILKFAVFWGLFFLLVGFFEEFLLRGYSQFTLTRGIGFWPAAIALSAIFGAIHLGNEGEAWIGALAAGCIGFFFCLTLRRTGNLWFAVGFHFSWDWGETYLYSVPNSGTVTPGHLLSSSFHGSPWLSGGSVGPEGSVLVFVIIAALWIAFDRLYPEAKYQA